MFPQQLRQYLVDLLQGHLCRKDEDNLIEVIQFVKFHDPLTEMQDMQEILLIEAGYDDLIKHIKPKTVATHYNDLIDVLTIIQHLCTLLIVFFFVHAEDVLGIGIALEILYGGFCLTDVLVPYHKIQRYFLWLDAYLGHVFERIEGVGKCIVLCSSDADYFKSEDHLFLLLLAEIQDLRAGLLLPDLALLLDSLGFLAVHLDDASGGGLLLHHRCVL